jgi:hypothetical protein
MGPNVSLLETQPLHIFLCHSSSDKTPVRELYLRLRSDGFDPWLDEQRLLPGQDWAVEIKRAVAATDVVIVCLSQRSADKAGYVQKEIKYALEVAEEQPEGTLFLIPLLLEQCAVPERLQRWQWVELFNERGYEMLIRALQSMAKTRTVLEPPIQLQRGPTELQQEPAVLHRGIESSFRTRTVTNYYEMSSTNT